MELINTGFKLDGYEENGIVYLNLEDTCLGLNFTKTDRKNGTEYIRINKSAIKNWLKEFGILNSENELPQYIPENIFYRLMIKASTPEAIIFQNKLCDEVIPSIRKYGCYIETSADPETVIEVVNARTIAKQIIACGNDIEKIKLLIENNRPKGKGSSELQREFCNNAVKQLSKMSADDNLSQGFKWDCSMLSTNILQESMNITMRAQGRTIQVLEDRVERLTPNYSYEVRIKPFSWNNRNDKSPWTGKWFNTDEYKSWKSDVLDLLSGLDIEYNGESTLFIKVRLNEQYADRSDLDNFSKSFQDVLFEFLNVDDSIITKCVFEKDEGITKLGYKFGFR